MFCYNIEAFFVLFNIFNKLWKNNISFFKFFHQPGPIQVLNIKFGGVKTFPVNFFSIFKKFKRSL